MRAHFRFCFFALLPMLFPGFVSGQSFAVSVSGPDDLSPCQQAVFEVTIRDTSALPHPAGTLRYRLSAGVEFVQADGLALLDSSDKHQPVFAFPGLGPNGNLSFRLTVQSTCAAAGQGGVTDSLFIFSGGMSYPLAACQYNLLTPALNLTPGPNWNYTGPAGSTYTCLLTLTNNGFGDIKFAYLRNPYAAAGLKLLNTSVGTWQGDTLMLTGADLGPDSLLTQGESIAVALTFLLDTCDDSAVTVRFGWSCGPNDPDPKCPWSLLSYTITPTVPASPVLKLTKTANFVTPGACQKSPFSVKLENTGAAAAIDVWFEVYISQGLCFPMSEFYVGNTSVSVISGTNSFFYWRILASALTSDPDGPGGLGDEDGDGFFDDLPAGASTTLSWLVGFDPGCKLCNADIYNNSINVKSSALNFCGTAVQTTASPSTSVGMSVSVNSSADFIVFEHAEGSVDTFRFRINGFISGLNAACPNDSFILRLPLPPTLETPPAGFYPLFEGKPVPYWTAADSALYLLLPSANGLVELPLLTLCPPDYPTSPCSYPPVPPIYKLHGEVIWTCGNGCNETMRLLCFDSKPFIVQCPVDTVVDAPHGIFTQDFGIWRIPANPNPSIAMPWDTTLLRATALIQGDSTDDFDMAMFRLYYWNGAALPYLRFLRGTLTISDLETGQTLSCPAPTPEALSTAGYHTWLFHLETLFEAGGCFADAGIHLSRGDFIRMEIQSVVTENIPKGQVMPLESLHAGFPYSWQQIVAECNAKGADFNVVNPYSYFYLSPEYSTDPCQDFRVYARFTQNSGSSITFDPFPGEPRPVFVYDTLIITIPTGYQYVPDSVSWTYIPGDGAWAPPLPAVTIPLPEPVAETLPNGTQRLIFIRPAWLPVTDFYGYTAAATLSFKVRPVCPAEPSQRFQAQLDAHGYLSSLDSVNIVNTVDNFNGRTLSGIVCTTMLPLSTGKYPSWDVTFKNNNNFNLTYPIISVHTGPRLLVTGATDITDPANPLTLAIVQIDSANSIIKVPLIPLSSSQTRKIRIQTNYLECQRDTVSVRAGHWCPGAAPCIVGEPLDLYAEPVEGGAQINLVQKPVAPVPLCAGIPYRLKILNVLPGRIFFGRVWIQLPSSGLSIIKGTCYLAYNGNTIPWPDPQPGPAGAWYWTVDFSQKPFQLDGLPGIGDTPANGFEIGFDLETDCAYRDGSRFTYGVSWENVCGAPRTVNPLFAPAFQLIGAPNASNTYEVNLRIFDAGPAMVCGSRRARWSVVNKGGLGPTGAGEKIRLWMPGQLQLIPGSYRAVRNAGAGILPGIQDSLAFFDLDLLPGVAVGDSIVFEAEFAPETGWSGCKTSSTINVQLLTRREVVCATAPDGYCSIDFIGADYPFTLTFEKPALQLAADSSVSVPLNATTERRAISFQVSNSSASLPAGGPANVMVYLDFNHNNVLDSGDVLIKNIAVALDQLMPGQAFAVSDSMDISPQMPCSGLLLVLPESDCHCGADTVFLPTQRFPNTGPALTICGLHEITVGGLPAPGAQYTWIQAQTGQVLASTSAFNYRYNGVFPPDGVVQETLILSTFFPIGECVFTEPVTLTTHRREVALTAQAPPCHGQAAGVVMATSNIPAAEAVFAWMPVIGGNTATLSGVPAGVYSVTVIDAAGCTATASAVVAQPSKIQVAAHAGEYNGHGITCAGLADGTAKATATGGTPAIGGLYGYAWSNGMSGSEIAGLQPGIYHVTATDARGCTETAEVTVAGAPPLLAVSASALDATCTAGANGSLTLHISGGVMPYRVDGTELNGTSWVKNGLLPGTYSFTLTDANGCTASVAATIGLRSSAVALNATPPPCAGQHGTASVTASGYPPFTYAWSTGANTADITAPAGSYSVLVTDALGCAYTLPATITEPPALTLAYTPMPALCFGQFSGTLQISGSGGTPPLTITLDGQPASAQVNGLAAGTYAIRLLDKNGCSQEAEATIDQPPLLTVSATSVPAVCHEAGSGIAQANATGGTPPYTWAWSTGETENPAINLLAGAYTITVTDLNKCTAAQSVLVDQPPAYGPILKIKKPCFGQANGELEVSGLPAGVYLSIDNGAMTPGLHFSGLSAGLHDLMLEDTAGCTVHFSVDIPEWPFAPATVFPKQDTINLGDSVLVQLIPADGIDPSELQANWSAWQPGWLNCDTCPAVWAKPPVTTEIKVRISTPGGCTHEENVRLVVWRGVWAPNAIKINSPENSVFTLFAPRGALDEIQLLQVFNRWGEMVFERQHFQPNDLSLGWDGTFRRRLLDPAVFVWKATVVYADGLTESLKGEVTILR